ncbi:hypothetical protein COLO4_34118 [Corchorus olitorius]|uniref:Uncharacterized protein n=1 Tax=Corchorus olitorius TaxID=93759 RepID=A0A1R3GNM8_9ROSI|nr:hypothetical protein COLO4_34118 [Corchorus olitorius]
MAPDQQTSVNNYNATSKIQAKEEQETKFYDNNFLANSASKAANQRA